MSASRLRVVVTGASGFLGRHLTPALAEQHEVVALSRRGTATGDVRGVKGDILDPASLDAAFTGADVVVHAAGQVSHSPELAMRLHTVHVDGTREVLAAARRAGVRRVVHISTSGTVAVSPKADFLGDEGSPRPLQLISRWAYYRTKLISEELALAANGGGLEVLSLNPSMLLGPGDDPEGASTRPVRIFLDDGVPLPPPGTLSYVDARDIAPAVLACLRGGQPGRRYLLTGANLRFAEFFARIARITGRPAPIAPLPEAMRKLLRWMPELGKEDGFGFRVRMTREEMELACHHWSVDASRAKAELGWAPRDPQVTLEDTVRDLWRGR